MVILLKKWILPIGGVASEGSAPAACTVGLFWIWNWYLAVNDVHWMFSAYNRFLLTPDLPLSCLLLMWCDTLCYLACCCSLHCSHSTKDDWSAELSHRFPGQASHYGGVLFITWGSWVIFNYFDFIPVLFSLNGAFSLFYSSSFTPVLGSL